MKYLWILLRWTCPVILHGLYTFPVLFAQPFQLPNYEHITDKNGLPQAHVSSIAQDTKGFIWMATLDGFCRYDGDRFRLFQHFPADSSGLPEPGVIGIQPDGNGKLWIQTFRELSLFDPVKETFFHLTHQSFYKKHFQYRPRIIHPGRNHRIWLSNQDGLSVVDLPTRHVTTFRHEPDNPHSLNKNEIDAILEDRNGMVWVATNGGGLSMLNEKTGRFTHYRAQSDKPGGLPENRLLGLYERPDGNLMITSVSYVTILNPATGQLKSYPFPPSKWEEERSRFTTGSKENVFFSQSGNLYRFNDREGVACIRETASPASGIISVLTDRSDVLWVGTSGAGVYKFNLKANLFYTRTYERNFHTDLLKYGIGLPEGEIPAFSAENSSYHFRYALDRQDRVWFNVGSSPFYCADPVARKVTKIPFPIPVENNYPLSPVPMATDPAGKVWVLYDSLAMWYDEPGKKWETFPHLIRFPDSGKQPRSAWKPTRKLHFVVDEAALWVATDNRGVYRIDRRTGAQQHYFNDSANPESLSSDLLFCLFQDTDEPDILWVGTFGSGLCRFNKKTGKARVFTTRDGLPNNVVYAAIPDRRGKIWIATNRGLCRMDRKTFAKRTFTRENGLLADEFNRSHFLYLPNGRILLGGLEGITSFYPEEILDDSYQPEVEITGLRINNEAVTPGLSSLIDSLSLQELTGLKLKHNQNSLTIEFAGLQYNSFKSIGYRFQLEGLDKDWIQAQRGEVTYTNLDPGRYLLKLNTTNTTEVWSPHVRTLSVVISPPWWANQWAYLAYFIAAVYLGYALIHLYIREKEAQHLRLIDELKTRFFSNITHDFRTPLTLILGPVRQLKAATDEETIGHSRQQLDTIEHNAGQLLQLVNQLLDLSKLEAGALQVETVKENLMDFARKLILSFQSQADEKRIRLVFESSGADREYSFDAGKLERILYNLVANALKFTGTEGKIGVSLSGTENGITVKVADTGCGIPAGKLPYIFDRFYQADPANNFHEQGTGIGLSLVKELVELQGGRISVSSAVGKGTAFSLWLPYTPVLIDETLPQTTSKEAASPVKAFQNDTATPNILIVEDNPELAAYVSDSLPPSYKVALAGNGKEGWEAALATSPDLVISDVMMPVMDGFEFCKEIKGDIRTSHIPVILLTAKVSHESRIAGLSYGADDYISKPFHMEELQLRVKNILERSKKYREWIQAQLIGPDIDIRQNHAEEINPFLKKVFDLLEANLDNASFGIDSLIDELGMSRMTLFRKLKTLTGYAAGDLIRNYRLNRAKEFLKEGFTISETAYKVGFNSLAYFSKCFRDLYHMTPSEFTREQR